MYQTYSDTFRTAPRIDERLGHISHPLPVLRQASPVSSLRSLLGLFKGR